jgi:hypothetical protein
MSDLPVIQTAYDMKALMILTACDIIRQLDRLGDHAGAYALKCLVETIETIPCEGAPHD